MFLPNEIAFKKASKKISSFDEAGKLSSIQSLLAQVTGYRDFRYYGANSPDMMDF